MGIVLRQSVKNIVSTYLGFVFGALNTLFLFTYFLSKEEYGLVGYVTSVATILTPLLTFGVQNTFVRFYSFYQDETERAKLNFMLFLLPFLAIIPFCAIGVLAYEQIAGWLSAKNEAVGDYVLLIFLTGIVMAYFEVFYAWMRVHLKSVFGNFLKEVFHRVGTMFLLFGVYLQLIDFQQFMWWVFILYFLRMLLMIVSAFRVKRPTFCVGFPYDRAEILKYSFFIILSGSVASVLMDIDKFMINQYLPISEIAIYNVAIFTATVVVIPYRSVYQIVSPLVAQFINQGKTTELNDLYKKSTIGIFAVSMLIFVLILINLRQFYALLPSSDYASGIYVVILISLVKLFDALVGINNAILFNSKYYRMVLYMAVFLIVITIGLNIWLIPLYGINGASLATFFAFFSYNSIKLFFIYKKYGMTPFYKETFVIFGVGVGSILSFYFWDFSFSPLVNILLKTLIFILILVVFFRKYVTYCVSMLKKTK